MQQKCQRNTAGVSYTFNIHILVIFEWDNERTSKKLETDSTLETRIKVIDGDGFKSAIGKDVGIISKYLTNYSQCMQETSITLK